MESGASTCAHRLGTGKGVGFGVDVAGLTDLGSGLVVMVCG